MKKRIITTLSFFVAILICSCSIDEKPYEQDHLMTIEEAVSISKDIEYSELNLRSDSYKVNSKYTIEDENGLMAILILNQTIGDKDKFSIISLDKRTLPILAFGAGEFNLSKSSPETKFWFDGQLKLIEKVRRDNPTKDEFVAMINKRNNDVIGPTIDPCNSVLIWNGPIVDHTWGQECVYNESCPDISCSVGLCVSPKAYTGCVATAITQILGYHEQPSSYPWSTMLNRYTELDFGATGATELAEAMAEAGQSVSMSYGCIESSVPLSGLESTFENSFEGTFGYSSSGNYGENVDISAWNGYTSIHSSVGLERPVILIGLDNENGRGHAWVCDGTRMQRECNEPTTFMYHMNWGWNGGFNGWYSGYGLFPNETASLTNITP